MELCRILKLEFRTFGIFWHVVLDKIGDQVKSDESIKLHTVHDQKPKEARIIYSPE